MPQPPLGKEGNTLDSNSFTRSAPWAEVQRRFAAHSDFVFRYLAPSAVSVASVGPGLLTLLPRLSHDINQRHLASHDGISRSPQGRAEVLRIGDWSFTMDAHTARNHRVVNIRIFKRRADSGVGYASLMAVGHPLDVHDLLMVSTIVVHDAEQRYVMMSGGPQRARSIHEITVVLDADAEPPIFPVGKRCANRCRQPGAYAGRAAGEQSLI